MGQNFSLCDESRIIFSKRKEGKGNSRIFLNLASNTDFVTSDNILYVIVYCLSLSPHWSVYKNNVYVYVYFLKINVGSKNRIGLTMFKYFAHAQKCN